MSKKILKIISIVSCIGLILCLFQISQLNSEVENLRSVINNEYSTLRQNIDSIYSNVDEKLEKQASLLSEKAFEYGEKNDEKQTVRLTYTVVPKEYNPDKTAATLYCNGKAYKMELRDNAFTVTLDLPIFKDSVVERIVFESGEKRQNEELNDLFEPRYDFVPTVYADLSGRTTRSGSNYIHKSDGYIRMESKGESSKIVKAYLVEYHNDKEISREEIIRDGDDTDTEINFELNKAYAIPADVTFSLYTEATDESGLVYRNIVDVVKTNENGGISSEFDDFFWNGAEGDIYDSDGNVLYSVLDEWKK